MSEKIYACLLRLFPSHFREAYGQEALQLFRDRELDERGFFPTLRLWFDLIFDLAISIPREYTYLQPAQIGASTRCSDGVPAFFILENESVRPGVLLLGGMLTVASLGMISNLLNQTESNAVGAIVSGQSLDHSHSGSSQQPALQPKPQLGTTAMNRSVVENQTLDAAQRQRVMDAVIKNLKAHYVDSEVAHKMADALRAHEKSGDYEAVTDAAAFADLVTRQIRDVSHDMHLEVAYSQAPLPASRFDALGRPLGPTPEDIAHYQEAMKQENCTFEKTEVLPRNIGYLKLNSFPDPSACRQTAAASMASLNGVDAVIFDLRDNRGGEPEMVALMAAYLFDHPEYLYNPRENTTQQSWTRSPVPENKLADKPVYVLTSASTFSGAEQFCYNLKMLKRATLVGETTGGAAHAGVFHRIDDHFGIGIPEARAINPYSKSDWNGTGVEPDVKVRAADALETAVKLAERKLRNK
jgi:hypothetical protein